EQLWIARIVERGEVISRNHEQVGRGLRIQILERHHTVGPLHDRRRNLARRDLAEDAPTHAPPLAPSAIPERLAQLLPEFPAEPIFGRWRRLDLQIGRASCRERGWI